MQCKNCGKKLKEKEIFCTICGYYNGEVINDKLDNDEEYNLIAEEIDKQMEDFEAIDDDESEESLSQDEIFQKAYIGEDYKLIKKGIFNIYAAFFNWTYLLYRKMYISGIIGLLISGIIIILLGKSFYIYLIIIFFIFGFTFNKIYLLILKKKIEKIQDHYQGSDNYTLEQIMKEKGGVNFLPAVIIYALFIVLLLANTVRIRYNSTHNTKYWKENSENQANCLSLVHKTYKELQKEENVNMISEAACQINKTTVAEYEIYLKDISTSNNVYYYYSISDGYIIHTNDTKNKGQLELKNANGTITEEEKLVLERQKSIINKYNEIYQSSKEEEDLIKQKKNTKEKKNYIFSQEEVNR